MAVIYRTGGYNFRKMCGLRKFAVVLTVLIGVLGFSFGDSPKKCDLVNKDLERTVKLSHLKFLQEPQKGKNFSMSFQVLSRYCLIMTYFEPIMQLRLNPRNVMD